MIKHLIHTEIDRDLWDACIEQSVNRLPYALSWWLDAACENWEALVLDDYRAVMPLTAKEKFGFHYLYQPYFTQQLGLFSAQMPGTDEINSFLSAIPKQYRYVDIQLNSSNNPTEEHFKYKARKNCILDLTPAYTRLASNYHRNCRRNIQKAMRAGLTVSGGPGPAIFTRFIEQHLGNKLINLRKDFYPVLQRIAQASIESGKGAIAGVYKPGGELLAAGWFVETAGRYIFLVCASTETGKEKQAMFLLVDHAIREKAGTGLLFDFAGSNDPGIAYFNMGFGAKETIYFSVKRNVLPWPLRLLK